MPRHEEDFAIVVGIDKYMLDDLNPLEGARADAAAFRAWLIKDEPSGGGVPEENVTFVEGTDACDDPTAYRIREAFRNLARKHPEDTRRVGRRLYVFMSGHGASHEQERVNDVGLLPATFSDDDNFYVVAQLYVEALQKRGAFEEIFLFMDCCRDLAPMPLTIMPIGLPGDVPAGVPPRVSTLIAYASQYGAKSRERDFVVPGRPEPCRRGVFTTALIEALQGWAVHETGEITKGSLERYLRGRIAYYRPKDSQQTPQVDGADDLVILPGPYERRPTRVVVRFTGTVPPYVEFAIGANVQRTVVPPGEQTVTVELEGLKRWTLTANGNQLQVPVSGEEVQVDLA